MLGQIIQRTYAVVLPLTLEKAMFHSGAVFTTHFRETDKIAAGFMSLSLPFHL